MPGVLAVGGRRAEHVARLLHGGLRAVHVARRAVELGLALLQPDGGDGAAGHQLLVAVVLLLRQLQLGLRPVEPALRGVERVLVRLHLALRQGERGLQLLHLVLEGRGVDAEQHVALGERNVGLHGHLDHPAPDRGHDGRGDEIGPGDGRVGMVEVHAQQDRREQQRAAHHGGDDGVAVDGDAQEAEGREAERAVGQEDQRLHQASPSRLASAARRSAISASSLAIRSSSRPTLSPKP